MKELLLAGVATALMAVPASAQSIKVGSAGGLTGPIAELLVAISGARQVAADQINAQGGLLDGQEMELVLGDSACDPKAAVDAATKLVNVDQVVAVVGPSCSGATNGFVQSVSIPAGVVVVSDSATAPSISGLEDGDTVFRVAASDAYGGKALADLAIAQGKTKLAVSYANDDYNAGLAEVFAREFKAGGGEITAMEAHEPNKASYRAEVATLAGGDTDTLALFAYYGSSGVTIVRNSIETGSFGFFIGADGMVSDEMVEQLGAENISGNSFFSVPSSDDTTEAYKLYSDAVTAADIQPAAPFAANGYDAAFVLGLAIEKAGSADRAKIAAALREVANAPGEIILPGQWEKAKALIAAGTDINYVGATGEIDFDGNGDVAGLFAMQTVNADGSWKSELIK